MSRPMYRAQFVGLIHSGVSLGLSRRGLEDSATAYLEENWDALELLFSDTERELARAAVLAHLKKTIDTDSGLADTNG